MAATSIRLRVFLCYASADKKQVRKLSRWLKDYGFEPWLDEDALLPGQEWPEVIRLAVKSSHVVLVCLSERSISKEGFVQKEIRFALDVADEKPEGTIFIIPLKLEPCDSPERLRRFHSVNLYEKQGKERLWTGLCSRMSELFEESPKLEAQLERVPLVSARLWYLASLTLPVLDENGRLRIRRERMNAPAIQEYHRTAFLEWLSMNLEEQLNDLRLFLALAEDRRETIRYLEHGGVRQLIPYGAGDVEMKLFMSDFREVLRQLSIERSLAE